jgi:phosphoribosyl 1,2-cyclic phosphodiesterase
MPSMPMRFCILGSGSSGNCALLQTEHARVLVDAGFGIRRLESLLSGIGESLERIDGIFLTHEHGDHAAGVSGLRKHPHVRVFANAETVRSVQRGLGFRPDWQVFETGSRFRFRDIEVDSFSVPHDAADPVGFVFHTGQEDDLLEPRRSLAWMTDLGHTPAHLHEHARRAHVVVVEANHCPEMLKADTRRPWPIKQRIGGRHGHLSNAAARDFLAAAASPHWRRVFLAHLSRDCNSPAAVERACAPLGLPFSVVAPGGSTPFFDLD